MPKKLTKNLFFQISYQVVLILVPFILTPYISRVFTSESVGLYSFSYSVVNYFVLFSMLGISNYATRLIAGTEKDNIKRVFTEIFVLHFLLSIICLIVYFCYLLISKKQPIFYVQSVLIVASLLDISWLFFGLEDFKNVVIKNLLVKIATTILVFCVVKNESDLITYAIIISLGTLLGNAILWINGLKFFSLNGVKFKNVLRHLKPSLILFIPAIAISFYQYLDKIMLGTISGMDSVGFYENAEKVISVPLAFITAFGLVMFSHACHNSDNKELVEKSINTTTVFVSLIVIPVSFGLFSVSDIFVDLYLTSKFAESSILIKIFCFSLVFRAYANIIRTQYMLPRKKDKLYVISVLTGALLDFILNLILIHFYDHIGAAIATAITEIAVFVIQFIFMLKEIKLRKILLLLIPMLVFSIVMFIVLGCFKDVFSIKGLLFKISLGIIIYSVPCLLLYALLRKRIKKGLIA